MNASGDPIPWRGLLTLRSVLIATVAVAAVVARAVLGDAVPVGLLLALVGAWAVTQVLAARSGGTPGAPALAGLMALDMGVLSIVFHWTGGAANPFTFLTIVYLALGAVVLPPAWAWALAAWAAGTFGLLFLLPDPLAIDHGHDHGHHAHGSDAMAWHLRGMWVGYVLASAAIVGFVGRIARALTDRDRELAQARQAAARSAQLASLATLAAGAAHELGTPLGTIAVVARELERSLTTAGASDDAIDDARLIGREVSRCRDVLARLRADAGDPGGEPPVPVSPQALLDAALDGLDTPPGRLLSDVASDAPPRLTLFARTSADALRDVIRNALDATPADRPPVEVHASTSPSGGLRVCVVDHGIGMDEATAARAVEPFFTTKPAGRGMGLGLFLARTVVERTGGRLVLTSAPGEGTTVTLDFAPVTA